MQRTFLKSKIHLATLTGTELEYEGSIAIDPDLLDAADMMPGEQVHVLDQNNGARLVTYIIKGERGSGTMMLNGPAALLAEKGDKVVVITYASMDPKDAATFKPHVVLVDEANRVRKVL